MLEHTHTLLLNHWHSIDWFFFICRVEKIETPQNRPTPCLSMNWIREWMCLNRCRYRVMLPKRTMPYGPWHCHWTVPKSNGNSGNKTTVQRFNHNWIISTTRATTWHWNFSINLADWIFWAYRYVLACKSAMPLNDNFKHEIIILLVVFTYCTRVVMRSKWVFLCAFFLVSNVRVGVSTWNIVQIWFQYWPFNSIFIFIFICWKCHGVCMAPLKWHNWFFVNCYSSNLIASLFLSLHAFSLRFHRIRLHEKGPVSFSGADRVGISVFSQVQDGRLQSVALFHPSQLHLDFDCLKCVPIKWKNGQVPIAKRVFKLRVATVSPIAFFIVSTLALIGIILSIAFVAFNLHFRKLK